MPTESMKESRSNNPMSVPPVDLAIGRGPGSFPRLGENTNYLNQDPDSDHDPRAEAIRLGFVNQNLEYMSQMASRDRLGWRLDHATNARELAPVLKELRKLENWTTTEAVNTYLYQNLISTSFNNSEAFALSHADLIDEGIIDGELDSDGHLLSGRVTEVGMAYIVKIDRVEQEEPIIVPHAEFNKVRSPDGTYVRSNDEPSRVWDEVVLQRKVVESPSFLSEKERVSQSEAYRQLGMQLLIGQKQHVETQIFDTNRAALEQQVDTFFLRKIGMGNSHFQEFFSAADIAKITPENPRNNELGEMRDRLMHVERLIGQCETREKMEKALNETFILEQILDEKTVDIVLKQLNIKMEKWSDQALGEEPDENFFERKFLQVARALIARDLEIKWIDRKTRDGKIQKVKQYELKGWLTAVERDVCTNVWQSDDHEKSEKKGGDAVEFEREMGVRGLLTNNGNTFTRGALDLQYSMNALMAHVFGDKKGYATRDADRFMWTRGEKDEMGAEIYAFKYKEGKDGKLVPELDSDGNMIPNLPTGEELVDLWNLCNSESEWKLKTKELKYLDRFSLPGEPVGSDLSKLFWAYLYALKDQINERPTGLLLGVDKMPRMSQSLLSLARTVVDTGFIDKDGKVTKTTSLRAVREQWDGYKGSDDLVIEPAKKLGETSWSQTKSTEDLDKELKETLAKDIKDIFDAETPDKKKEITDALFKIMNIDDSEKQKLIKNCGSEEMAFAAVIGKYFDVDQHGIATSVDEFYKLFNYLAGNDNPAKRPHAYFMGIKIDPRSLLELDSWTGKKKFLQIIFNAAGAFGDFRKYDIRASKQAVKDPNKVSQLSIRDQKRLMKEDAERNITKVQEGWLATVMSHPDFPKWEMGKDKYKTKSGSVSPVEEPFIAQLDVLAKKYGFFNKEKHIYDYIWRRMKIFES